MTAAVLGAERYIVASPTGVDLMLPLVGPGGRVAAFLVDLAIRASLAIAWYCASALASNLLGGHGMRLAAPQQADAQWVLWVLAPSAALYLLYHPIVEAIMRGRTPGKRLMHMRIIAIDGSSPSIGALLVRNLFRIIDSFPGVYCVGLLATLLGQQHQRFGDLAAGTLLVYDEHRPMPPRGMHATRVEEIAAELQRRWQTLQASRREQLARDLLGQARPQLDTRDFAEAQWLAALAAIAPSAHDAAPPASSPRRLRSVTQASQYVEEYRALARELARARQQVPDSQARAALEGRYAAAHAELYRPAFDPGPALLAVLRERLPATVGALRPHIAWVTALFLLAVLSGWLLIMRYPDLAALFASAEMIATVKRGELWTDSLLNVVPSSVLSVQLLTNNIVVSLFAFCAGFLFGLGTFYIIGLNGLMLGALFAMTQQHGMAGRLFEFIAAHGPVELSCICLAGAAGAAVGEALIRPQLPSRAQSFAAATRSASELLLAVVLLLLGCGFIEGYVSPNPDVPLTARMVIGAGYFVLMIALLRGWLLGRSRPA